MLFNQLTLCMLRTNVFFTQLETFEPTRACIDFTESSARMIVSV
jgi:hypothetical protein